MKRVLERVIENIIKGMIMWVMIDFDNIIGKYGWNCDMMEIL